MQNKEKKINPYKLSVEKVLDISAYAQKTNKIINIKISNKNKIKKELDNANLNTKPPYKLKFKIDETRADLEGVWSWRVIRDWNKDINYSNLLNQFKNDYKNKTWEEIFSEITNGDHKHKHYPINKICKEAIKRLTEIEFDDFEEIFRFRLLNKFRFYGFTVGDKIDVGVEILPMKSLQSQMSSGPSYYEGELYNLIREGRGVPAVPLVLLGIAP